MTLNYTKKFRKQFKLLQKKDQKSVEKAIRLFEQDPKNPKLRNHALKGKMKDKRSISAGDDLRLIFREYKNYTLVLFLKVGSHNQVY